MTEMDGLEININMTTAQMILNLFLSTAHGIFNANRAWPDLGFIPVFSISH